MGDRCLEIAAMDPVEQSQTCNTHHHSTDRRPRPLQTPALLALLLLAPALTACSSAPSTVDVVEVGVRSTPTQPPTATPIPTPNPVTTPTPTATPTPTPTFTPTPTPVPTPTPTPTLDQRIQELNHAVARISTGAATGSGVLVETDETGQGTVLTNAHVIFDSDTLGEAKRIEVSIEGRTYDASVVGYDYRKDLAVLSICCSTLFKPLTLANTAPSQGTEIFVLGYPLGIEHTTVLTRGVVSAIHHNSSMSVDVLQIDSPINPGNSGGGLFTMQGELIGIPTYVIRSDGQTSIEGAGFAITSREAATILPMLKSGHRTAPHVVVALQLIDELGGATADTERCVVQVVEDYPAAIWIDAWNTAIGSAFIDVILCLSEQEADRLVANQTEYLFAQGVLLIRCAGPLVSKDALLAFINLEYWQLTPTETDIMLTCAAIYGL